MAYRRVWAEINLDNMAHNIGAIRGLLPASTALMGIVKADAYGHGAVPIAYTMLSNGVSELGVATYEEGFLLRQAGINAPILVMGFTPQPFLQTVIQHNLTQTVFSKDGACALSAAAAMYNKRAAIHIEIDTGMSRLGFLPTDESVAAICDIAQDHNLYIDGIYTHFATSDQLNHGFMLEQELRFNWVIDALRRRGLNIPKKHMSNSGAVAQLMRRQISSDNPNCAPLVTDSISMDVARAGILLYGLPPSAEMAQTCADLKLKPVMRLLAQISMIKILEAGVGISYGHIYKTTEKTTLAVLPIGYADGYPRRLSHGGRVLVRGKFAPIAGAICMDQCMADATSIKGVSAGDTVVLLGSKEEGLCADDLADIVGTISYEIICGIGKRVPRVYVNDKNNSA